MSYLPVVEFDQFLRLFGLLLSFQLERLGVQAEHLLELGRVPVLEEGGRVFR